MDAQQRLANRQVKNLEAFYRNYHTPLDNLVASRLLATTFQALPDHLRAPAFGDGRWINERGVDSLYQHSIITSLSGFALHLIEELDTGIRALSSTILHLRLICKLLSGREDRSSHHIDPAANQPMATDLHGGSQRREAGLQPISPDANSTLRITFGSVQAIQPRDVYFPPLANPFAGNTGKGGYRRRRSPASRSVSGPLHGAKSNYPSHSWPAITRREAIQVRPMERTGRIGWDQFRPGVGRRDERLRF